MNSDFIVKDLGFLDYKKAYQIQLDSHRSVVYDKKKPILILVEHPRTITFGRKGGHENLLVKEDFLKERGFALYDIERGGDVTYHGPGQLVGYPIFKVGIKVDKYLRRLEHALINVLADYGIKSVGSPGYAGVWVGNDKVVAIGVSIKRNVSFHGFAMNVSTNLNDFNYIVPCGLKDKGVASLSSILGQEITIAEVKPKLITALRESFA